ncbi:MAG: type II toxin-antitoxin system RelE/ParE family toxin [Candidatus Sumerlaeota bacterium]|nr:type II toxin-antitoxin system RelE/ParE family toxin [Candidatus Sumerlaeota bacterium]
MTFTIEIRKSAQKSLGMIAKEDRDKLIEAIRKLTIIPRPSGSKKLSGREAWRIRVGHYRVIYEIYDKQLIVVVISVGHRREIYRFRN